MTRKCKYTDTDQAKCDRTVARRHFPLPKSAPTADTHRNESISPPHTEKCAMILAQMNIGKHRRDWCSARAHFSWHTIFFIPTANLLGGGGKLPLLAPGSGDSRNIPVIYAIISDPFSALWHCDGGRRAVCYGT